MGSHHNRSSWVRAIIARAPHGRSHAFHTMVIVMGISGCMIKLIRRRNQRAVTGIVTGVVVTVSDSVPHIIYGVLRERGDGDLAPQIIIETGRVILVAGTRPENICDVRETIVIVVKVSSSRIPAGVIRIAVRVIAMTRVLYVQLSVPPVVMR